MTNRTAATRYARALVDVAVKEGADLTRIETDLATFVSLIESHAELSKALLNPAVPVSRKRATIAELVARASATPMVGKLMTLIAERDRFVLLPDILEAYRQRLLTVQNVVRAHVTTATPLPDDQARRIEQSLARATGRTVRLTTRVDPAIIGGVVARIDDTVYDGSITSHLQRMKHRLTESL